ncbi:hypothetical protein [Actinomadura bangladeshensis]|uniref:Uncharacterized protein n=1 Tax=Actinomadura bangladeshensis TaxID=453573 RepID=A0A6L9QVB6_9ACTN|nr:hypothetical protein [Actinomadura bangladeshensis]NEA29467.1 hypothetical protein [Actinomadura bangladeshensis]
MNAMARTYHRINWTTGNRPPERPVGDDNGGSAPKSRAPLSSPLQTRATDQLETVRLNNRSEPSGLTRSDSPCGGFIGRGAQGLSRPALAETLTGKVGVSWIRTVKPIQGPGQKQ